MKIEENTEDKLKITETVELEIQLSINFITAFHT